MEAQCLLQKQAKPGCPAPSPSPVRVLTLSTPTCADPSPVCGACWSAESQLSLCLPPPFLEAESSPLTSSGCRKNEASIFLLLRSCELLCLIFHLTWKVEAPQWPFPHPSRPYLHCLILEDQASQFCLVPSCSEVGCTLSLSLSCGRGQSQGPRVKHA